MTKNHECSLKFKTTSGYSSRVAPNAHWIKKCLGYLWTTFLLNPNHCRCKDLYRNKPAIMAERKQHASSPYFFVIHPLSKFNFLLQTLFFITWMYGILCEAMILLVHSKGINFVFGFIEVYVIIPLRIIVVLLFFDLGYIDKETNEVVTNFKKVAWRYFTTYFIFDSMACYWPHFLLFGIVKEYSVTTNNLYLFRWDMGIEILCIACCFVRIKALLRYADDTLTTIRCYKMVTFILIRFIKTYIFLHMFSLFVYLVPYLRDQGRWVPKSWCYHAKLDASANVLDRYLECLLMAFCYFFGVSAKYEVELVEEEICVIIVSLFGRLYTLFLLGDVLNTLGVVGVSQSKYNRYLSLLQRYMIAEDLPQSLRRRMLNYYEYRFQGNYFNEDHIMNTLSETLRTELFLYNAKALVQNVKIFKNLPSFTMGQIIAAMRSEIYTPRDVILKLGTDVDEIYFISRGTVAVVTKRGIELCHLEDGDEFGTSCLMSRKQIYTTVAVETTEVFIIDKNTFIKSLDPHPDVMNEFYRSVKARFAKLAELEREFTAGKIDLMSEIRTGHILERRTKRIQVRSEL